MTLTQFLGCVLLTAVTVSAEDTPPPNAADSQGGVTFYRDALPVLQKNCQTCHRPGQIAPMSFLTYESTRPWAKAIKVALLGGKMPPWLADTSDGRFRNAPTITQAEIETLVAWVDGGAREGDPRDKTESPKWAEGWRIQPDVVASMEKPYTVPAKGEGEVKEFEIPNPFEKDTWVSSIEIKPGNPSIVHHVLLKIDEPKILKRFTDRKLFNPAPDCDIIAAKALIDETLLSGSPISRPARGGSSYFNEDARFVERETGCGAFTTMEAVYAPGTSPLDFRFANSAKLIPGKKPLRMEVHYTPNGRSSTTDQTQVAFTLAEQKAARRFVIMAPEHLVDTRRPIPAGDSNFETRGELTFNQDADLVWFMPHMHLRGKDMTISVTQPDGREEIALSSRFSFQWQLGYELDKPIHVTKGTRMTVTAHHDNSANNPTNPAPGNSVGWGDLTNQEMMLPWFGVVVDVDTRPEMIASYRPGDFDPPGMPAPGAAPMPTRAPTPAPNPPVPNLSSGGATDLGFWIR